MLISTMNHQEVLREFWRDLEKVQDTSLERLQQEYCRERKRNKVAPTAEYPKVYQIKSKAKNNWLIFLRKPPAFEKCRGTDDLAYCCVTWYHAKKGLCVLRKFEDKEMVEVFWGHLLTRYRQRMKLSMEEDTVQTIKRFINHNGFVQYIMYPSAKGRLSFGICKEGFLLGEVQHDGLFLVNKTFVSKDLAFDTQNKIEELMIQILKDDLSEQMVSPRYDELACLKKQNLLSSL